MEGHEPRRSTALCAKMPILRIVSLDWMILTAAFDAVTSLIGRDTGEFRLAPEQKPNGGQGTSP
jgi:hypothetical protein